MATDAQRAASVVAVHPWPFPVQDAQGQPSQLLMGVTGDGRVSALPPEGPPFTVHPDQVPDWCAAWGSAVVHLDDAKGRAATARSIGALRSNRQGAAGTVDEPANIGAALGDQERVVAELVTVGYSNAEIATRIIRSEYTAKEIVKRLCVKYGAANRTHLVRRLYETGDMVPLAVNRQRSSLSLRVGQTYTGAHTPACRQARACPCRQPTPPNRRHAPKPAPVTAIYEST